MFGVLRPEFFHSFKNSCPFRVREEAVDPWIEDLLLFKIVHGEDIEHHLFVVPAFGVAGSQLFTDSVEVFQDVDVLAAHDIGRAA